MTTPDELLLKVSKFIGELTPNGRNNTNKVTTVKERMRPTELGRTCLKIIDDILLSLKAEDVLL